MDQTATPERTEQLRRSMPCSPGQPSWLTRENAEMILGALVELQRWADGRILKATGIAAEPTPSTEAVAA